MTAILIDIENEKRLLTYERELKIMTMPELKKRLKRARKNMVGRKYEYYPTTVAFNKGLPVGQEVIVATMPHGDLNMLDVVKVHECKRDYVRYATKRGIYRYREEWKIPEEAERFTIFMRDLTVI